MEKHGLGRAKQNTDDGPQYAKLSNFDFYTKDNRKLGYKLIRYYQ